MDLIEFFVRVGMGTGLAALLGIEREATGKDAGFRTHAMVGLGAALFTVLSAEGFAFGDPARVAAQIVTGIGFLGAGAIFRSGPLVKGLTTAAGLWAAAAVGMAAGAGQLAWASLATLLAGIVLVALRWFDPLLTRLRVATPIEATISPREKFLEVRDRLESVDPRIELRDLRTEDDRAILTFMVHPRRATMLAHVLEAMEEVVAVQRGREP